MHKNTRAIHWVSINEEIFEISIRHLKIPGQIDSGHMYNSVGQGKEWEYICKHKSNF